MGWKVHIPGLRGNPSQYLTPRAAAREGQVLEGERAENLIIHGRPRAIGLDTVDLGPACCLPVLRDVGGGSGEEVWLLGTSRGSRWGASFSTVQRRTF